MDPLPFDPPMIRKCIKTNVRIQGYDDLQEVLILTTVLCSVESQLNRSNSGYYNLQPKSIQDGSNLSNSGDDMSGYSETSEDYISDYDDNHASVNQNGDIPQDRDDERYKMKAFWLRKDPICEVRLLYTLILTICIILTKHNLLNTYLSTTFKNHHGIWTTHIYHAKVLHKADLYWILTKEEIALKTISWRCIQACQKRLSEDFVQEISALQYLYQWRAAQGKSIIDVNVMTADTVMCDECYLYIVMPFCMGGDLCQRVAEVSLSSENNIRQISHTIGDVPTQTVFMIILHQVDRFSEEDSRFWFRQILKVRYERYHTRLGSHDKTILIIFIRG